MAPKGMGKGLGKGLDSLIPSGNTSKTKESTKSKSPEIKNQEEDGPVSIVKITKVEPNREQPRKNFEPEALQELSDSIRQFGVISPIIVQDRKTHYEIIAGERRWRAAKLAGLKEVPVIIKNYSEQEIVEIALIENIQREDLNPIEEALAYKKLLTEFNLKQEEVAQRVSKSRTAVTNSMRLLKLSEKIQKMIIKEEISSGHARTLLSIEDEAKQEEIAEKIIKDKLSVRDVEKLVKALGKKKAEKKEKNIDESLQAIYENIAEKMKQRLSTKVKITPSSDDNGSGKFEIEFYSHDDMERIVNLLLKQQ